MDNSDKYIGRILDNRYEILELIGTGGMALVYKARCHRLNRYVAIKILKEDLAGDEEFRRRFHIESQAVGMLSHPNIVAVYDVSRSENTEYIVMELIEGITLKQYINRKGLLNWKEALHFATQVTKALSHAHSRGIIHRDIKPHNIMILKDGSIKVADFGIARLLTVQNTLTQEALGSVHYISPEQAKGGHVDARSDIYSVGVVMYEMLTSRLPFVGESAVSVAIQHISAIPLMPRELNPDIPVGFEDITMHAMEPDLNLRFTTADEMLNDLEIFRKNPSTIFNYILSDPKSSASTDTVDDQNTKIVPPSSTALTERKAEKTEIQIAHRPSKKKPDMTSDEYRTVHKRATNTSTLVGIFFIILFIVAIAIFMWNYLLSDIFGSQPNSQIEVPDFVSRAYSDIIKDEEYGELYSFRPPLEVYSDEIDKGLVISQSPIAGTSMESPLRGSKIPIDLTISKGDEPLTKMPDLVDQHFSTAKNTLDGLGMELVVIQEPVDSEVEKGYVIRTIPEAGEYLARGNSVTIIYSGGLQNRPIEVPKNLVGRSRAQVESALNSLDIIPVFIYWPDDSPAGTVLFIQYAGQEVTVPRSIEVHVSSGPAETPSETPTETPSETPTETPTPSETPTTDTPVETPIDTPPETPIETSPETSTEQVSESPVEESTIPPVDLSPQESPDSGEP